jgi:hypothetical protein
MKFLALQKQFKAYCRKVFCVQCMKKIILALKINLTSGLTTYQNSGCPMYVLLEMQCLVANSITLPILHKNNLHDIPCFSCKKSFHLKVRPKSSGFALNPIFKLEETTSCTSRLKQQF